MYDFGNPYRLSTMHLWNCNQFGETNQGINEYIVDYSMDGITWISIGEYNLDEATGSSFYEGQEGPDFNLIDAQYVLITAVSNHGGACYSLGEMRINIESSPVPVDLVYFNGECDLNRKAVNLNWETTMEINNAYFSIERSDDNRNWSEIKLINSKGESTSATSYAYRDKSPIQGESYYRLIQVDRDGSINELNSIYLNCRNGLQYVEASPNPFNEKLTIKIFSEREEELEVKMYSALGQLVYAKEISGSIGENKLSIEPNDLSVGQYFLTVKQGNSLIRKKLVYSN